MPAACAVDRCPTQAGFGIVLHSFPRDGPQRQKWVEFLRAAGRKEWTPAISSRICSLHFEPACYKQSSLNSLSSAQLEKLGIRGEVKQRALKPGALPTIYPGLCPALASLPKHPRLQRAAYSRRQATQSKSCVDQVRTLGSQTETGHVTVQTSTQTAMVFPRTIPVETRPTYLRRMKLLGLDQEATASTNREIPLPSPSPKPDGTPENCLGLAAAPATKRQTSDLPNFKALVANSTTRLRTPLCANYDSNSHHSTLPSVPPIIFATPCNSTTISSQSELLASSTDASSQLSNLPSGTAIVFTVPCHNETGTAHQTKLLCSSNGARSRDVQLSSAPTVVLTTPLGSETSEPLVLCFSHDSSSSNPWQPLSEPKVLLATPHHAEAQLSQSRLLCSSSNSLLPNMPILLLTTPCQAEAPHHTTPENCVSSTTVPVMQVFSAGSPSSASSQATQCKSCVDRVRTLGSQTETAHGMVETSTQTTMAFTRTIPVQTRPTILRSLGTSTGPE